jgi:undecaprenyl-diphosphatase
MLVVGSPAVVVTVALSLAGLCLWLGHRRLALLAVAGPGLTGLITTLSKPLIGRTIDGDLAYPSGHAGGATAIGLVTALVLVAVLRPSPTRAGAILAAGALVAGGAVAVLLVAANWHYATDAVGGICTAITAVLGSALALDAAGRSGDAAEP